MKIAITGATGFIGRELSTRALASGHEVLALSRRPWTGPPFVPLEDRVLLDLPSKLPASQLSGVDAVIHLAVAPNTADRATIDAVNRVGTEWLFESARTAGVPKFIFVSSQSAHLRARSAYGQSKFRAEQFLSSKPEAIIVRPGLVFGDGNDGLVGRVSSVAAKLRFFPVVGGKAAVVQPLWVGTLCDALLRLVIMSDPPGQLELAEPIPEQLGSLIQRTTRRIHRVRPIPVPIPMNVARAGLQWAERLHVPAPISMETLDGIEHFRIMDTTADMANFGHSRPDNASTDAPVKTVEPRRLLLIGAGRIGLVHALSAVHHPDMVLVGIHDLDAGAAARLAKLSGAAVRSFTDLDNALAEVRPDAAIIATPPSTHVSLAQRLVRAGVDVLIEKPVAVSDSDRAILRETVDGAPERTVATGYLAGLLPHLSAIRDKFLAGGFGTPISFEGYAFVSRIEGDAPELQQMWEVDPRVSGGGALVNLGVHVLAMLDMLLGEVSVRSAALVHSPGRAVEDGATLTLTAGAIPGRFSTAWHLGNFAMPENYLSITTSLGRLFITTCCTAFVANAEVELVHQTDADEGFDLAPLDAGGAFWAEQRNLGRQETSANSVGLATRIEELIRGVYSTATRLDRSELPSIGGEVAPSFAPSAAPNLLPDLRTAPREIVRRWHGSCVSNIGQYPGTSHRELILALPDAPSHFRTLTNKGPKALVEDLGFTALAAGAFGLSLPRAASSRGRIWEALLLLLRAELQHVPRSFEGVLLLDAYVVDLATAIGTSEPVLAALEDLRARCPRARLGIEANAPSRVVPRLAALREALDVVLLLGTPHAPVAVELLDQLDGKTEIMLKTGPLPAPVLAAAWEDPDRWTQGPRKLVVHWPGVPTLTPAYDAMIDNAKRSAGGDFVQP